MTRMNMYIYGIQEILVFEQSYVFRLKSFGTNKMVWVSLILEIAPFFSYNGIIKIMFFFFYEFLVTIWKITSMILYLLYNSV